MVRSVEVVMLMLVEGLENFKPKLQYVSQRTSRRRPDFAHRRQPREGPELLLQVGNKYIGFKSLLPPIFYSRSCLPSSLPSLKSWPIVADPFDKRPQDSSSSTCHRNRQQPPPRQRPPSAYDGQHKAIDDVGTRPSSCDTAQVVAIRVRAPPLARHRCLLLHYPLSSGYPGRTTAARLSITTPKAMG